MRIERRGVMDDIFGRPEKRCACCGRWLERTEYNKSSVSSDGLQSYCRGCQRAYHRKHPSKQYKRRGADGSLDLF